MTRRQLDLSKLFTGINVPFTLLVLCLFFIGVALQYSAGDDFNEFALKQLMAFLLFCPLYLSIAISDIRFYHRNAYLLYAICIILLLIAEVIGHKAMGAQRWIKIGPINFQPSELMKIGLILALSRFFHDQPLADIKRIRTLIVPLMLIALPVLLVLRQPNLGTSLILIAIAASLFFTGGVRIWKFLTVIVLALLSLPLIWSHLHDYQKKRVLTFLDPESDPLGAGYNIIQSIIGIGSGGMFGFGFNQGPQNQLDFLPEKHTDFIFTILAEEFGFLGVFTVFALCITLYIYGLLLTWTMRNQFSRLVGVGVLSMFVVHILINTGMISGLLPVVGVPFPLLSYGGSNQIAFMLGFSLFLSALRSNGK